MCKKNISEISLIGDYPSEIRLIIIIINDLFQT